MRLTFLLPALMALAAAGQAADNTWELRFGLGLVTPGIKEDKVSESVDQFGNPDPANDETSSISAENGIQLEPGVVWCHPLGREGWGLVVGGNLFYRTGGGKDDNVELTMTAFGVKLLGGVSYQLQQWQFELTPFLGFGSSKVKGEGTGFSVTTENGSFVDLGLAARAVYAFNDRFSAGLVVGFDSFSSKNDVDLISLGGDKQTDTFTGSGIIVALTAGWKLGSR